MLFDDLPRGLIGGLVGSPTRRLHLKKTATTLDDRLYGLGGFILSFVGLVEVTRNASFLCYVDILDPSEAWPSSLNADRLLKKFGLAETLDGLLSLLIIGQLNKAPAVVPEGKAVERELQFFAWVDVREGT